MAKQLDPEQFEDIKEMMIYEVVLSEALVNLLDKKGPHQEKGVVGRDQENRVKDPRKEKIADGPVPCIDSCRK